MISSEPQHTENLTNDVLVSASSKGRIAFTVAFILLGVFIAYVFFILFQKDIYFNWETGLMGIGGDVLLIYAIYATQRDFGQFWVYKDRIVFKSNLKSKVTARAELKYYTENVIQLRYGTDGVLLSLYSTDGKELEIPSSYYNNYDEIKKELIKNLTVLPEETEDAGFPTVKHGFFFFLASSLACIFIIYYHTKFTPPKVLPKIDSAVVTGLLSNGVKKIHGSKTDPDTYEFKLQEFPSYIFSMNSSHWDNDAFYWLSFMHHDSINLTISRHEWETKIARIKEPTFYEKHRGGFGIIQVYGAESPKYHPIVWPAGKIVGDGNFWNWMFPITFFSFWVMFGLARSLWKNRKLPLNKSQGEQNPTA